MPRVEPSAYHQPLRHLARRDPVLRRLIAAVGPCTLRPDPDHFRALVRSIIAQQISTKAAASINARLAKAAGRRGLTSRAILRLKPEALRAAGLSTNKTRSVRDLAEKVHRRQLVLGRLRDLPDEEVIAFLLPVHGIGRWTAEMFLIFSLGRLDVLPVADWGLRVGAQRYYHLTEPPGRDELTELAKPWQPYRSIATWYLRRGLGFVPQSGLRANDRDGAP